MIDNALLREQSISRVVEGLVQYRPTLGGWEVQTPLLYPSGAFASVAISGEGENFSVSDLGAGFREAYAGDVGHSFGRAANELSEEFGLIYEKRHLSIPRVTMGRLGAAVRLVANCSQASVILAIERANERKIAERSDRLYARLKKIFPNTAKHAQIMGASSTEWTVDALVQQGDHMAVFDAVTTHANSVASTSMKFHDIALREDAPTRAASVESKRSMGTLLAVLSQAANVIEDAAPDQQYRQLAEAA